MSLTTIKQSTLTTILSRATFLSERINFSSINSSNFNQSLLTKRLQLWSKFLGGEAQLNKRLQWSNLDRQTIDNILGSSHDLSVDNLLDWQKTFLKLTNYINLIQDREKDEKQLPIESDNPLPFEDFYLSFLLFARKKLSLKLFPQSQLELLTQEAYQSLERSLLQQLVDLGAKTLLLEFEQYRQHQVEHQSATKENKLYQNFIKKLLEDHGLNLFEKYPVLARLMVTTIDFWIESTAEFIHRLSHDYLEIKKTFSENLPLGKVKEIDSSLSNPHNRGRIVLSLTFTSDTKIVYKPKDLGLDVAFNQLLDWCNQHNLSLSFKLINILQGNNYGWMEFIEHLPCDNQTEVESFYKRIGMLLSLLYILGAKDCQNTQIITNGENPILIDADSLMSMVTSNLDKTESWFYESVIQTGILPAWEGNIMSASTQDNSVLGGITPQQVNSSREWKFINTDEMKLVPKTTIIQPPNNIAVWQEKTVFPNNYINEIITGFTEMYYLLMQKKESLLGKDSPLIVFQDLKYRLSFRSNLTYKLIAYQSLSPQFLHDGIDYGILIDTLSRPYLMTEQKPPHWLLLNAEIQALQQLDIPYFMVSCKGHDLELGQQNTISNFCKASDYQQLRASLESINEKDLTLQIALIKGSFSAKFAKVYSQLKSSQDGINQLSYFTKDQFLQEAVKIGNHLVNDAIWHNKSCNWLTLDYMFNVRRFQLRPLSYSLYDGSVGVSLFLSALGKVTDNQQFIEVAKASLFTLHQSCLKSVLDLKLSQSGLGLSGLGGMVYSLVKISDFLQDKELLEDAQQISKYITKEAIATDQTLDIMGGVAGTMLGLLSLYQKTEEQEILEKVIASGNHLVACQTSHSPKAWKTIGKKPLTGFSHGAAGNAYALLKLYEITANSKYLEAAKEGIKYEKSVFNTSVLNWPDFRGFDNNKNIKFLNQWCHGSAGIGLSRLGSLPILQDEETYSDINIALQKIQHDGFSESETDFLCCGSFGRLELLIMASQRLYNTELLELAKKRTTELIEQAKQKGGYHFFGHSVDLALNPSFFRGTSGIGYQLLRLARPELFPSVLILE